MIPVAGEMDVAGRHIALVASGDPEEMAYVARTLQTLTPLLKDSKPPGGLIVKTSWPVVVQLANTLGPRWLPGPRLTAWITEQVKIRTEVPTQLRYTAPEGLTPYPWQVSGAAMIAATGKELISDEPGTGKTITTILGLAERSLDVDVLPILVVAPASVVDPWVEAFNAWAPHWTTIAWRGSPSQRWRLPGRADVYIVSYDTCRVDTLGHKDEAKSRKHPLLTLAPKTVVADEHHKIKGSQTRQSKAVRKLAHSADTFVALSGTPIAHNPADLWPALDAMDHEAWPARERWVQRYCQSVPGDYGENIVGLHPGYEREFRTTLLGQFRRVAKADVLDQLPPKVYSVRTVELPKEWRKAYDDLEAQMLAELPDGQELPVMSVLAQLTRLSQLASAAADVAVTEEVDEETGETKLHYHVTLKAPSWKVTALLEVMEERPGQPIVCFAPSRQLMVLAGETAAKAGHSVGYVIGAQSAKERTETIEAFQAGKLDLLCVTTAAGGVGITLTAARTAVFLQRPWSMIESSQAEDRLHRIGAERHESVEIIDILASKTIDTRVRAVLKDKAGQLAELVQDPRVVAELLGGSNVTKTRSKSA